MKDKKIARKAVLIYPRFNNDSFWSLQRTLKKYIPKNEFGLPKRTIPPLGLMGVADYTKPYYEKPPVIIDRNVDPRPLEKLIADADHIYMGGMAAQEEDFLESARIIANAGIPLIKGGTIVDKEFLEKNPLINMREKIAVENEAEMVMPNVIDDLANQRFGGYYKGIHTPPEKFFRPDFSSINMNNYMSMPIQVFRGCPFDCEFCDITTRFGRKIRMTPWEYTKSSIQQLYNLGYRGSIFFVDDQFIGNPRETIELLKRIYKLEEELDYHFPKYTQVSLNLSDNSQVMRELRYWFRKTNFTMDFIGVETNNKASLKETGKRQNLRGETSIEDKLSFISEETGAANTIAMIHGFDNDSTSSIKSLTKFINRTSSPTVMLSLLNALPYTRLWNRLEKQGRLMKETSGNNSDGTINFIPHNFSAQQAERNYVKILQGIYNEKAFFTRVMRELELIEPKTQKNRMSLMESLNFGIYFLTRLFTKENKTTFMKYLPHAHKIAVKRFGFGTPKYWATIGLDLAHCAKFTHFKGQTEYLEEQLQQRKYEPWQLYSWKEIQESNLKNVKITESKEKTSPSLFDMIKIQLENGYEFVGTRLEALTQFVEPYIKEGLQKLKNIKVPSIKQFKDIEVNAYFEAHLKMPEILGNLDFKKVKSYLTETFQNQKGYLPKMNSLFKNVVNNIT